MRFWDYLYLDINRLEDYWSRLDHGSVDTVKEIARLATEAGNPKDKTPGLGELASNEAKSEQELVSERTLTITAKHSFSRLYDKLDSHLVRLGEEATLDQCPKGSIVEVTRDFAPSPVNQMLESLFELMEMMQGLGGLGVKGMDMDPQAREAMAAMSFLFRQDSKESQGIPLLSEQPSDSTLSVLFVAEPQSLLVDREELEGEMTVLGKVQRQIPAGQALDLLDFLKVLPRTLRRNSSQANNMREGIVGLFENWPSELGGAVDPESLTLHGPAIVVSPLAVYT